MILTYPGPPKLSRSQNLTSLAPYGDVALPPVPMTPEGYTHWQVRMMGLQGMGFAMPDIVGSVKGWFESRGMDWRVGLGIAVLAVISMLYIGAAGTMEK